MFKFAVSQMAESVERLLQRNGLTTADVAVVIPHQANQRILDATADHLGLPHERMATVIARYGNTTAATLPLALEEVVRARQAHAGRPGGVRGGGRGVHGRGRRWCGGVDLSSRA